MQQREFTCRRPIASVYCTVMDEERVRPMSEFSCMIGQSQWRRSVENIGGKVESMDWDGKGDGGVAPSGAGVRR